MGQSGQNVDQEARGGILPRFRLWFELRKMGTAPLTTFTSPEINVLTLRYLELRTQRDQIELKMKECLDAIRGHGVNPKASYHCRRCGHTWTAKNISTKLPINCARCHSSRWMEDPVMKNARRPGDPPNPKWHVRKGEALPEPPRHLTTKRPKSEPPTSNRQITSPPIDGLAPPPKLADVLSAAVVPPASVRFAEEPLDGVPVRINEDGSITRLDSGDTVEPEKKEE